MDVRNGMMNYTPIAQPVPGGNRATVEFGRAQADTGNTPVTATIMMQSAQTFLNQPLAMSAASAPKMNALIDDLGKLGIDADTIKKLDFGTILKLLAQGDTSAVLELVKKYKDVIVEGMMNASDLSPFNAKRTPEQRELQRKQLDAAITGGIAAVQIGLMIEAGNYFGAAKCAFENRAALYELAKQGFSTSIPGLLYKYLVQPKQANADPTQNMMRANASLGATAPIERFLLAQSPILAFAKSTFDQAKAANALDADRFAVAA